MNSDADVKQKLGMSFGTRHPGQLLDQHDCQDQTCEAL